MIFEGTHMDPSLYISELAAIGIQVTSPPVADPESRGTNNE